MNYTPLNGLDLKSLLPNHTHSLQLGYFGFCSRLYVSLGMDHKVHLHGQKR